MVSLTGFLVVSVLGVIIYYLLVQKDRKKYPPGPFTLPLVGNLLQLATSNAGISEIVPKWAEHYGSVFRIKFGPTLVYFVSDVKALREVYNDPAMSARPDNEIFRIVRSGPHGIVASSGSEWVEQRRFSLRHLRDFGFGKNVGEEIILGEVHELLSSFAQHQGQSFTLDRTFNVAVLNTLWMITTGNRYHQDEPELWSIFNQLQEFMAKGGTSPILSYFPSLGKLFPNFFGWNALVKMTEDIHSIIQSHIDQHIKSFPEDDNPRDFIDAYLKEINNTSDFDSSFHKSVGIRSLKATMVDFFLAGSDTVTTTLLWSVLYLSKFPEVQKRFQHELDNVVGRNRHPNLADRPKLPYWEALLTEITRYSSLVPFGLQHVATEDRIILGYDCPKGTEILGNVYGIHFSEKYFDNPKEFRPERFLSNDGKSFKKSDAVLPFGSGKRACMGETLARDELFLFLSSMFHRFNVRLADENKDIPIEPKPSFFVLYPHPYKVIMSERN